MGYAVAVSDEGAKLFSSFELTRLYIFYRFHGHGLGKRLVDEVLSFAKQQNSETIWLQVHEANSMPLNFTNTAGLSKPGLIYFELETVLTES